MAIVAPPMVVPRGSMRKLTIVVSPTFAVYFVRSDRSSGPVAERFTTTKIESLASLSAATTHVCPSPTAVILPSAPTVATLFARLVNATAVGGTGWPEVVAANNASNIHNYTIYLYNDLLFSYFEYTGDDYAADMEKLAANLSERTGTKVGCSGASWLYHFSSQGLRTSRSTLGI